ncbi:MAG: hypothetical protein JF595_14985 [Sphingomonadales bacterium]|nr:hypothetical protein [Sphingomonadales bacterium]
MPKLRNAAIAGAATLLFAGAAVAATARFHTMAINLPDGSVAHITYAGDVAPKVSVDAADTLDAAYADPVMAMDRDLARVSAMMEAQRQQMMREVAAMQQQAVAGQTGQLVVTGNLPAGSSYHYTMVSTSSGKSSCTQTVEWRSDGPGKQPQVTKASAGDCGTAKSGEGDKPVPVSAPQRAAPVDPRSI